MSLRPAAGAFDCMRRAITAEALRSIESAPPDSSPGDANARRCARHCWPSRAASERRRGMRGSLLATGLMLALAASPAQAQDEWSSPGPGVRLLRRAHRGIVLRVATADLAAPELRPAVVPLDPTERDPSVAAAEHDAFIGLAVNDAQTLVPAARSLIDGPASSGPTGIALGADALWGAVGLTDARVLVLLSVERGRVAPEVAEETLRSLGVVRAVPVRGPRGASLMLRGERVHRGDASADAMIAVRLLPGAVRELRAPALPAPPAAPRGDASVALRPPPPVVQVAGVSVGAEGPPGFAWLALSVLGCLSVALGRRAREDE